MVALGQVVRRLRREKGLTQEELGEAAGYHGGAGVSISRLENGRLEPTEERFSGIACALGLIPEQLRSQAIGESGSLEATDGERFVTREERIAMVVRASERREQLAPELDAFRLAVEKARDAFLLRFHGLAARIGDAPVPDGGDLGQGVVISTDEAEAEVAYQIRFTQYGVASALASPPGGGTVRAVGSMLAYLAFTEAIAWAAASLGGSVSKGAGTAQLRGLRSAMSVEHAASRFSSGLNLLAAVAYGTAAGGAVATAFREAGNTAKRSRSQQAAAAKLSAAEADIAASQANVDALWDVVPRATEVLDYIAIHASHALERWGAAVGDAARWNDLSVGEQERYQDFVAIAAAQLAVTTIDLQELATRRDGDLDKAFSVADQVLVQASRAITSRV